jgi:hypothetical protein
VLEPGSPFGLIVAAAFDKGIRRAMALRSSHPASSSMEAMDAAFGEARLDDRAAVEFSAGLQLTPTQRAFVAGICMPSTAGRCLQRPCMRRVDSGEGWRNWRLRSVYSG